MDNSKTSVLICLYSRLIFMTQPKISKNRISKKAGSFTESVIREMTREAMKYGAINLGQGFPDFAAPEDIKQKAMEAISEDHNQYAITWGCLLYTSDAADE